MASHIPHPHSSSHKGAGYAFSLNLIRSLGLWSPRAPFPSDVQKPAYICLNPANNTVDWSEQLRKYTKHNTDHQAQVNAACTRLELAIWRAIDARTSKNTYLELQKRRLDRRRRFVQRQRPGSFDGHFGESQAQTQTPPPDELLIKKPSASESIQNAKNDLLRLVNATEKDSLKNEARIILALASYASADFTQCLGYLESLSEKVAQRTDTLSHDLDLQVLAIVLQGMANEQVSRALPNPQANMQQALDAYRSLPVSPPPPIPEAQRYLEMGLARLAILDHSDNLQACRLHLSITSSFKSVSPVKRLIMYRTYLTTVLDELRLVATTRVNAGQSGNQAEPDTSTVFVTIQAYEQLLYANPSLAHFPSAGKPTVNMYDYMDLLYSYWDLGVIPGKFTVDSLYRALSKTYSSQKLQRYLVIVNSTLSFIENDRARARTHALQAKRSLRLYIQQFEKSRETDSQAVQEELNIYGRKHQGPSSSDEDDNEEYAGIPSSSDQKPYSATERDEDFCRIACIGTRLLLTESRQDGKQEQEDDRVEMIEEALTTIEKAKKILQHRSSRDREKDKISSTDGSEKPSPKKRHGRNLSKEQSAINAEVHMWLGVARVEWALADADPEVSRNKAKLALEELQSAVDFLPEPPSPTSPLSPVPPILDVPLIPQHVTEAVRALRARTLYSLAYAQLEARDVGSAISTARQAVDIISNSDVSDDATSKAFTLSDNIKIWHLFVLALSARKDLIRAVEVTDLALFGDDEINENADEDAASEEPENRPPFLSQPSKALSYQDKDCPPAATRTFTRADAPYDPSATGTHPKHVSVQLPDSAQTTGNGSASSFVKVKLPNGAGTSPSNGTETSMTRTRSPSIAASTQGSTAGKFLERRNEPMTLRTTSPWHDLEAEIDFMITRNHCIESIEGPEVALQDLQQNVFTRFSRKRDDLERALDPRPAEDSCAISPRSPSFQSPYPYSATSTQNGTRLAQQLDEYSSLEGAQPHARARSLLGSISIHRNRSRANTAMSRHEQPNGNSATIHLAVPDASIRRPASVRSDDSAQTHTSGQQLADGTNGGSMSGFLHIKPSPQASAQPIPVHPQAARVLTKLWLASAATFRRWGKFEECLGAINEAEIVADDKDPQVWLQYALYLKTAKGDEDLAHLAMSKALAIYTDHIPTCLLISKTHLDRGSWAIAEGFLDTATQTNAWDSPEAWYLLAKVYENTRRRQRAKECLLYALELENSRPIRDLRATLPRYI